MSPFQQGYAACTTRNTCPYPSHTEQASQWRHGWWTAVEHKQRAEDLVDAFLRDAADRRAGREE